MISKKLLAGLTIGAVVVGSLGMWLCRGDEKAKTSQLQSEAGEITGKKTDLLQRLIMQMQSNAAGSESSATPEADTNQRAEDEQQWQVLDEKRQARIDRLREKQKNIAEAVDRDREEQIGE